MDSRPLIEQARDKIRAKHYSLRTEEAYPHWMKRFILFHRKRHPREMGATEVEAFLSHLAVAGKVFASTQNQAKSALLFMYKEVLQVDLPWLGNIVSAKRPTRLPVVLTQSEVASLLTHTSGTSGLILRMVYGTGMRIMECMRLRVKDIEFERSEIVIREGKGFKDRITMLPKSLVRPLQEHLARVKLLHEQDLHDGYGEVFMPYALARKYPNAGRSWIWAAPAHPCACGIRTSMCSTGIARTLRREHDNDLHARTQSRQQGHARSLGWHERAARVERNTQRTKPLASLSTGSQVRKCYGQLLWSIHF